MILRRYHNANNIPQAEKPVEVKPVEEKPVEVKPPVKKPRKTTKG